ncbi:DUF4190 domain-containing protein [Streptomyces atratus]|uniref:DUF4190 domain-containing protein n=1 Tax=Streptomyces atratus TaxID=1893 RepID=UPI002AC33C0B|nr:DUF4190 domain-containing protein [Streptomyces atratus]WPW31730.1 DUF4190 domain-containing protein [Streptomyces atratus]
MSDNTEQPAGGAAPRDPWAPPDSGVPLEKPAGDPRSPAGHDQPTVTSMPGVGDGPAPVTGPGFGAGGQTGPVSEPGAGFGPGFGPGEVPPPPIAPNGPGQQLPPAAGQYGYPAPPAPQYGSYPGYTGYNQAPWGGTTPSNGMGTAAMVLGILAVCLFCIYGIPSLILGALALIFGILGRKRAQRGEATNSGQALAGIIMGSIGIAFGVAIISFFIWLFVTHADEFDDNSYNDDPYSTSLVVDVTR